MSICEREPANGLDLFYWCYEAVCHVCFVFGFKNEKKTFNPWIDAWHLFVKFESSAAARDVPSANPYQLFYFIGFIIKFVRPIHAAFVFIFFICLFVAFLLPTINYFKANLNGKKPAYVILGWLHIS